MESIVLERLLIEVKIKPNQYGEIRGSSMIHFLISIWERILSTLEDPATAMTLMSVDFSKAFNRVDHVVCLQALAENGTLTDSLAMISSFLKDRCMRFKVNNILSSERQVKGGSPQGTKLGNFLFIITIDRIEEQ